MYDLSAEMSPEQAARANQVVRDITHILATAQGHFTGAGEKISVLAGATIPSLSAIAMVFSKAEEAERLLNPTSEEILFGALYIATAAEDHPSGIIMGYSPDTILKTLELFQKVTGREYTNIHPVCRQILDEYLLQGHEIVPAAMKKFTIN